MNADGWRPRPVLLSPVQLRSAAERLRAVGPVQARMPFERVMSQRVAGMVADALDELARVRAAPARDREALLEQQVDAYGALATSRRIPLAAVEALALRAENTDRRTVTVDELWAALARREP